MLFNIAQNRSPLRTNDGKMDDYNLPFTYTIHTSSTLNRPKKSSVYISKDEGIREFFAFKALVFVLYFILL